MWCSSAPFNIQDRLQEFLFPSSPPSKGCSWRLQAKKDLRSCFDCAQRYHELLDTVARENSVLSKRKKDIFQLTVQRVTATLEDALQCRAPVKRETLYEQPWPSSCDLQQLKVPLKEALKYPRLLLDERLHSAFIQGLLAVLKGEEEDEDMMQEKLPGVYLLLVHPDEQVSNSKITATEWYNVETQSVCIEQAPRIHHNARNKEIRSLGILIVLPNRCVCKAIIICQLLSLSLPCIRSLVCTLSPSAPCRGSVMIPSLVLWCVSTVLHASRHHSWWSSS